MRCQYVNTVQSDGNADFSDLATLVHSRLAQVQIRLIWAMLRFRPFHHFTLLPAHVLPIRLAGVRRTRADQANPSWVFSKSESSSALLSTRTVLGLLLDQTVLPFWMTLTLALPPRIQSFCHICPNSGTIDLGMLLSCLTQMVLAA